MRLIPVDNKFYYESLIYVTENVVTVECRSRPDLNAKLIEQEDTSGWIFFFFF